MEQGAWKPEYGDRLPAYRGFAWQAGKMRVRGYEGTTGRGDDGTFQQPVASFHLPEL